MIPFMHRLSSRTMEDNPLWLVVLADMMTNLMLFFLVMYALAQQGPAAQRAMARSFDPEGTLRPEKAGGDDLALRRFRENRVAGALKKLFSDVSVSEGMIRVRLKEQLLFKTADASLSDASEGALRGLAGVLREIPNEIVVEGHTDDVRMGNSPYRSNWELSVARSYSVIERLAREGVPPERLVAAGYGEHRPVESNESREGRAKNRRVEVIILRGPGAGDG